MSLYERVLVNGGRRIDAMALSITVAEVLRGRRSEQAVSDYFELGASAQSELMELIVALRKPGAVRIDELRDVLLIAQSGFAYTTVDELKKRIGV